MAKNKEITNPFAWNEVIQRMSEENSKARDDETIETNNILSNETKSLIALVEKVREQELTIHWGVNLNADKPNGKTPEEYRQEGINIMADSLIKALHEQ